MVCWAPVFCWGEFPVPVSTLFLDVPHACFASRLRRVQNGGHPGAACHARLAAVYCCRSSVAARSVVWLLSRGAGLGVRAEKKMLVSSLFRGCRHNF